ncbi:MAG: efflux RND transporter periplasmic adaptor subunit [Bacteroidota bacterium]
MAKKKKSGNKLLFILGGIVLVLIIVALIGKSQGWIGQKKAVEVESDEVKRSTIVEKVSASGAVQPVIEVKISPEVSGEIIQLKVEEGDSVAKGDFLLKIRPDNFISAYERSLATLNQQKANYEGAKASLERAKANFTRAELTYNRQKKLFDERVISDSDFEQAQSDYTIAKQDLESAKQQVVAGQYIVESSMATVEDARENLRLTEIMAPMSGIVSKLAIELGETVVGTSQMQGTEMLRIADLNNMEVRVNVNENDIIRISVGDTSIIDVDSYSHMEKQFKGVVTQIANTANVKASADAVTEFEVRIKILNSSYQDLVEQGMRYPFRPGMTASVEILTESKSNVISVPLAAVTTRKIEGDSTKGDESGMTEGVGLANQDVDEVVFKLVDGKAVKAIVKTGISDYQRIEILSGLEEGDKIIKGPFLAVSKRLNDGDAVEVTSNKGPKEEAKTE